MRRWVPRRARSTRSRLRVAARTENSRATRCRSACAILSLLVAVSCGAGSETTPADDLETQVEAPKITGAPETNPSTTLAPGQIRASGPFEVSGRVDELYEVVVSDLSVRLDFGQAPAPLKTVFINGTATFTSLRERPINPPSIYLGFRKVDRCNFVTSQSIGLDGRGAEWCILAGSAPSDGYQIGGFASRSYQLTDQNSGQGEAYGVQQTWIPEDTPTSAIYVCVPDNSNMLCVDPTGDQQLITDLGTCLTLCGGLRE